MSFWKTLGFSTVSAIDNLLDSGEYTLEQLLDEEEILQETKGQNRKLIEFLSKPESLRTLLTYITQEPADGADQKRRFKYPFLACEILASEVYALIDSFYEHKDLLDQLYSLLEKEPPLSAMLASYSSRVAGVFLQKKVLETIQYLQQKQNIIDCFINHLGNASVMDLLLKVIASEELVEGTGTLQWLCGTSLIESLVKKFNPSFGDEIHENASQALVDIVETSSMSPNSPLIGQLESEPMLNLLFSYILEGKLNSSMYNGMQVLIQLVRRHQQESLDTTETLESLPPLLKVVTKNIEKFYNFLIIPEDATKSVSLAAIGPIVPLGFHRWKVIEFFAAFVRTNVQCISKVLIEKNVITRCLELFFAYPWNNFLHTTVSTMIEGILTGPDPELIQSLVTKSRILDKITHASDENEKAMAENRGFRRGYMGFITNMSSSLLETAEKNESLKKLLSEHAAWQAYCGENGPYQVARKRENAQVLGDSQDQQEEQEAN